MTETALALRPSGYLAPPSEDEFRGMIFMAKQLAEVQGFVPAHFYRQPNKVLAAMLYGRDLGITPTNALQHIIVIDGKATADAQLMGMLVRRAGHRLEDKTSAEQSSVTITRCDDGSVHEFTFTMQDARRAGLVRQGSAWEKYPQAMLFARALTGCARKGAQDALMGVAYTPEELGAEVEVVDGQAVVVMAPGVSEATAVSPPPTAAIQPTPPAPSEGAEAATAPANPAQPPSAEVNTGAEGMAAPTPAPAPPVGVATSLGGASVQRRMGRSIGPAPVRKNVVTVEQGAEKPKAEPAAPLPPLAPEDPITAANTPAALTDEPVLAPAPEPEDPGKAVYLNQLRGDLRVQTAELFRVNALLDNVKRGLERKEPNEVPPATPSEASDQALAQRIDADFPGRKLENLHQEALEGLLERFSANLAKKRSVLKERGITEE